MAAQSVRIITDLSVDDTLKGTEDVIIFNDTTNLAGTFDLGTAYGDGREFALKNIGTCTVSLTPATGETIEGGANLVLAENDGVVVVDSIAGTWTMQSDVSNTITTHPYSLALGGTAVTVSDVSQTLYVNKNRTDTYTADGSMLRPYLTIQAAIDRATVLTAAHVVADTYPQAVFTIDVAYGDYDDNLTIGKFKNLTFRLHGAYISGDIAYDSGGAGGSADNYYSRLEFIGVAGNRPEKGCAGRITGDFVGVRSNDSLAYVSFSGMDLQGHIAFNTNGTWVVAMHNTMFGPLQVDAASPHRLSAGDAAIVLLETTGYTIITGHIAAAADGTSVTAVSLYNCDNTEFDLINISNAAGSRITNCRFNSTTTVTGGTVTMDGISWNSLVLMVPTTTGATLAYLDDIAKTKIVNITSAQITGVAANDINHASGVILVAGIVGFTHEFVSATIFYDYLTDEYAGGGDDTVILCGANTVSGGLVGASFLLHNGDTINQLMPLAVTGYELTVNTGLALKAGTAWTAGGAGVLRVHITYRTHRHGL
jgi:hypothetical protein